MKKKIMTLALTAAMAASMGMTAFAGQWVQNTTGWWWQEDNGSYPVSQWKWLDGNNDGIYECYALMLSRLVDTFFSRTSWTMLLYAGNHSISVA